MDSRKACVAVSDDESDVATGSTGGAAGGLSAEPASMVPGMMSAPISSAIVPAPPRAPTGPPPVWPHTLQRYVPPQGQHFYHHLNVPVWCALLLFSLPLDSVQLSACFNGSSSNVASKGLAI